VSADAGVREAGRTATYAPARPVDLRLTLGSLSRGRLDPTMRTDGTGVWRTAGTPEGPATLHLAPRPFAGEIRATAWGPGADCALAGMPALLGEGDDWEPFDAALADTPSALLLQTRRRVPGLRLPRTGLVFEMLAVAVLEQKVTGREARRSWRELLTRFGTPPPGPAPAGMRVCPPPGVWRRIPSWEWHRAGVDPKRARTVLAAAAVAPALERTLDLGRGEAAVEAVLRTVPGVGAWTAAEVAQRAHGDPDAVSVGDFHLAGLVGWALAGRPLDDAGMLDVLAAWAPWRYRAVRLVEVSGARKPRFGPRYSPLDQRGW